MTDPHIPDNLLTVPQHLANIRTKKGGRKFRGVRKGPIHTTIEPATQKRLIEMGQGRLNDGIELAVKIADGKSADTRTLLMAIANRIISEYGEKQELSCGSE